jgi:hypothetical protein
VDSTLPWMLVALTIMVVLSLGVLARRRFPRAGAILISVATWTLLVVFGLLLIVCGFDLLSAYIWPK